MNDFRDLMYDLIIESLVDKLENYEITIEDAELFSEAAYDELFYEGDKNLERHYLAILRLIDSPLKLSESERNAYRKDARGLEFSFPYLKSIKEEYNAKINKRNK